MMFTYHWLAWLPLLGVLLLNLLQSTQASLGDSSFVFQQCLENCKNRGCYMSDETFEKSLPWYMRLLRWNCADECRHVCMWVSVDAFIKDKSPIPQFYGKWPFIRVFGIQEPASVLFSFLNLLSHLVMIVKFRKAVPSSAPMFYVWHLYFMVAVITWIASMVFHCRDLPLTEMVDYFCATLLVLTQLYALACRIIGTHRHFTVAAITTAFIAFFSYHVNYLAFVKFDYGYNMKVMVSIGAINSLGWFLWCALHWKGQHYVRKCALTVLLVDAMILLELLDFPPIWWVLDAHALWHAGTAPLALIWYSFAIDDSIYLQNKTTQSTSSGDGGVETKQKAE